MLTTQKRTGLRALTCAAALLGLLCGNGYDRVIADEFDFILPGCEQVETPAS